MPIGAQMYTLREHCRTVDGIARCLERVKQMGYDGIQASAAGFGTLDLDEIKAIKKALDDNGLVCGATHESLDAMDKQTDIVIEKHKILDCPRTAVGGFFPKPEDGWSKKLWTDFIKRFNDIAAKMNAGGIALGYHNHSHELAPVETGERPLQMLVDGLDKSVWFEFDVYWLAHGLADPVIWIEKVKGRIPCVHYKDGVTDPKRQHIMMSVGAGNLNWQRINAAAKAAGVNWYFAERDQGPEEDFQTLEISIKNMKKWGL